jgi:hypothetical protein
MKQSLFAVFITIFFSVTGLAQEKSADTMLHKIFRALQTKDEAAFLSLFPDYKQMNRFLKESMVQQLHRSIGPDSTSKINVDSLLESSMEKMTEETFKSEMHKEFTASFYAILKEGEDKGLTWNKAVLVDYNLFYVSDEEGFPAYDGILHLKEGGKEYKVAFDQVIDMEKEGGFFGVNLKKIVKGNESLDGVLESSKRDVPQELMELSAEPKKTSIKKTPPAKKPVAKPTGAKKG